MVCGVDVFKVYGHAGHFSLDSAELCAYSYYVVLSASDLMEIPDRTPRVLADIRHED